MISYSFFLDGIIAFLLLVTITYCWKLSKKIALLHEDRKELGKFIKDFNIAISRAERNITEIKELGGDTEEQLCEHIKKARFIANDLAFLMDKGESVADALEHQITESRSFKTSNSMNAMRASSPHATKKSTQTNVTLQKKKNEQPSQSMLPSKKQALDDVLSQIALRKKHSNKPNDKKISFSNAEKIFDKRHISEIKN